MRKRDESLYKMMDGYRESHDDLPDGAFFEVARVDYGFTADDWAWFSDEYYEREKAKATYKVDLR